MKTSNKTRLVFASCISIISAVAYLAFNNKGIFIPIAFIVAPLLIVAPIVITGAYICPKCNNGVYSPPDGEADMNPYYIVLFGRCRHCGERI